MIGRNSLNHVAPPSFVVLNFAAYTVRRRKQDGLGISTVACFLVWHCSIACCYAGAFLDELPIFVSILKRNTGCFELLNKGCLFAVESRKSSDLRIEIPLAPASALDRPNLEASRTGSTAAPARRFPARRTPLARTGMEGRVELLISPGSILPLSPHQLPPRNCQFLQNMQI